MKRPFRQPISLATGKQVKSLSVFYESPTNYGTHVVFSDDSELNLNFESQNQVVAEIVHYRWEAGEASVLEKFAVLGDASPTEPSDG